MKEMNRMKEFWKDRILFGCVDCGETAAIPADILIERRIPRVIPCLSCGANLIPALRKDSSLKINLNPN